MINKILGDLSFSLKVNPADLSIELAVNAQWTIPPSATGSPFPYPTYVSEWRCNGARKTFL